MKPTGIVRRIDELGRVVIPKEIRRTMHIREGAPLEIFTDSDGVMFKKYSPVEEIAHLASAFAEAANRATGMAIAVCDLDCVIAAAGIPKKEVLQKPVSHEICELYDRRSAFEAKTGDACIKLLQDGACEVLYALPIISDGSLLGCIAAVKRSQNDLIGELCKKVLTIGATFLGTQI